MIKIVLDIFDMSLTFCKTQYCEFPFFSGDYEKSQSPINTWSTSDFPETAIFFWPNRFIKLNMNTLRIRQLWSRKDDINVILCLMFIGLFII